MNCSQPSAGRHRRGEIDPQVDLDTLLASIMAIGQGLALNDLPALGVSFDKLEIVIRAMVVGMLRPTQPIPRLPHKQPETTP